MANTNIEDRYFILPDDESDVRVNVIIGNGQTGGYLIFLDKKLNSINKSANLKAANKLAGKRCLVSATVVDQLDETNWTSVTVELVKGTLKVQYGPYSNEAANHLDTVSYTVSIYFHNPQL